MTWPLGLAESHPEIYQNHCNFCKDLRCIYGRSINNIGCGFPCQSSIRIRFFGKGRIVFECRADVSEEGEDNIRSSCCYHLPFSWLYKYSMAHLQKVFIFCTGRSILLFLSSLFVVNFYLAFIWSLKKKQVLLPSLKLSGFSVKESASFIFWIEHPLLL